MLAVLGDSHGFALMKGLELLAPNTRRALEEQYGALRAGMLALGPDFMSPFHRVCAEGIRFTCPTMVSAFPSITGFDREHIEHNDRTAFGLCIGLHHAIIMRDEMWARFDRVPEEGKDFISLAVYTEICKAKQKYIIQFWRDLKACGVHFFVIAAPPVRQEFLLACERNHRCSAASTKKKIREFRSIMAAELAALDVPIVCAPGTVADDEVLKPEYCSTRPKDQHHGNPAYGALVWEQMVGRDLLG